MREKERHDITSYEAQLYDGKLQLDGTLLLLEEEVIFKFKDFERSHLQLSIPVRYIEKIEEFLVFDLARNGIKILTKNGRYDLFVLHDLKAFKNRLRRLMGDV